MCCAQKQAIIITPVHQERFIFEMSESEDILRICLDFQMRRAAVQKEICYSTITKTNAEATDIQKFGSL